MSGDGRGEHLPALTVQLIDQSDRAPFYSMMHGALAKTDDFKLEQAGAARLKAGDCSILSDRVLFPRIRGLTGEVEVPRHWPAEWNCDFAVATEVQFDATGRFVLTNLAPAVRPKTVDGRQLRGCWGVFELATGRSFCDFAPGALLEVLWAEEAPSTLYALRWADDVDGYVIEAHDLTEPGRVRSSTFTTIHSTPPVEGMSAQNLVRLVSPNLYVVWLADGQAASQFDVIDVSGPEFRRVHTELGDVGAEASPPTSAVCSPNGAFLVWWKTVFESAPRLVRVDLAASRATQHELRLDRPSDERAFTLTFTPAGRLRVESEGCDPAEFEVERLPSALGLTLRT